jgi:hypothetical protein
LLLLIGYQLHSSATPQRLRVTLKAAIEIGDLGVSTTYVKNGNNAGNEIAAVVRTGNSVY